LEEKRKLVRIHLPLLQYHVGRVLLSSSTAINQSETSDSASAQPANSASYRKIYSDEIVIVKMNGKTLIMNLIVKEKARSVMLILLVSD